MRTTKFASVPLAAPGSPDSDVTQDVVLEGNKIKFVPITEPIVPPKEPWSLATKTRNAKQIAAQYEADTRIHPTSPTLTEIGDGPMKQPEIELSDDDSTETDNGGGKMPAEATNTTSIMKTGINCTSTRIKVSS
jgi:hypothetical protein